MPVLTVLYILRGSMQLRLTLGMGMSLADPCIGSEHSEFPDSKCITIWRHPECLQQAESVGVSQNSQLCWRS